MRRLRSLRARITLSYTAVLAGSLGFYAIVVWAILARHLWADLDLHLHEAVEVAVHRLEARPDGVLAWRGGTDHWAEEEPGGARWIEVWSPEGRLLLGWASASPGELGPPPSLSARERSRTIRLGSGTRARVLAKAAIIAGRPVVMRAGRSEEPTHEELRKLLLGLGFLLPMTVLLCALVGYPLVTRLLGPVRTMAARARRITAERLHERIPVHDPDDELGQLARAFNEAFARLEESFDRLHRFTADASHELRTPLTALRSVGEVGLQGSRGEAAYREIIGSMLEETDRLTRLVNTLLVLARGEGGETKLAPEELDLAALVREVVSQLSVLAEERDQRLVVEGADGLRVNGDPVVLRQAIANLVDNAIKHGPEGGAIRVRAGGRDQWVWVEVADGGPGIAAAHRERIFDRFYRVDRSRSREMGGAGLGLALVKWAVEAHGGRVELESEEGRGSTFRIVLPASGPGEWPGRSQDAAGR